MFSNNNRISLRQTYRLFLFDFLGISTLILPSLLAGKGGIYGILSILVGGAGSYLYLNYLYQCRIRMEKNPLEVEAEEFQDKKWKKRVVSIFYWILFLLAMAGALFLALTLTKLMGKYLIQGEREELILLLILAVVFYASIGGIESRGRIYETLFWFVLFPLFGMLFFSLKGLKITYLLPRSSFSLPSVCKGGYQVFLCFLSQFYLLFFHSYLPSELAKLPDHGGVKKQFRMVKASLATALSILLIIYVILLQSFGERALAKMEYPIITLMSTVQITGGFMKRTDAIMLAIWFFTMFALLNMQIFYGSVFLARSFGKTKKNMHVIIMVLVTYGIGLLLVEKMQWEKTYLDLFKKLLGPIGIALPIFFLLLFPKNQKKKKKGRILSVFVSLGILASLTGCKGVELEEKYFPMMLILDYDTKEQMGEIAYVFPKEEGEILGAGDFVCDKQICAAIKEYEKELNKIPDYNHMKVIMMGEAFLEQEKAYGSFLSYVGKGESFPRNTYVCMARDTRAFLEIQKQLPKDLGGYIEDMMENKSKEESYEFITLGDLIDEEANQLGKLMIPVVGVEDGKILLTGEKRLRVE